MASKKGGGGNFRDRFSSLTGAGGNHPGKGKDAILGKDGRVSYEEKAAKATGKENPNVEANKNKKEFKPIQSPIGYDQFKKQQDKNVKNEPDKEK